MEGLEKYTAGLTRSQKNVFEQLVIFLSMEGGGYFLISGVAGTGKTYLLGRVLDYLKDTSRQRVALTAPTHKALAVLRNHTQGANLYTTHAFFRMKEQIARDGSIIFVKNHDAFDIPAEKHHMLIVDEVSMLDDAIFDEVEDFVEMNKKVIFVGDPKQIPPISMKNSLPFENSVQRELNFRLGNLDEIVRQAAESPIIQTASKIREAVFKPVLPLSYESSINGLLAVRYCPREEISGLIEQILDMYVSKEFQNNADYVKIVAWTNREVDKYNRMVREKIFGEDLPKIMKGEKLVANAPILDGTGKKIQVHNNEEMEVLEVDIRDDQLGPERHLKVYVLKVRIHGFEGNYRDQKIQVIHEDAEPELKEMLKGLASRAKLEKQGTFQAKSAWMDFYKLKNRYADVKYLYAITAHKSQGSTYDHCVVMMYDIMKSRNVEERNRILYTACTRPKYTLTIIH